MAIPVTEGFVDFDVPTAGKACKTWYKVFGDLNSGTPLVGLHGGPGAIHDYLLSIADLAASHSIPVVLYDQLGNGHSTHLREKAGDTSFWTEQLFLDELDNLLTRLGIQDSYAVLGHSWGGMLGARHATLQPKGLKALIVSDSPASMTLWLEAAGSLLAQLPQDVQDILQKHERDGTTDSQEYKDAMEVFNSRYVCRLDPLPEEVKRCYESLDIDPTVYLTMNGPSEFHVIGPLKDWTVVSDLHKITVPTLLLNGEFDEAKDSVVLPFFNLISRVKWYTFPNASHMPQWEAREKYVQVVGEFLKGRV
ncbi:proline-specific peptidase [Obba rivulosa]|uniref:Proline-specific peptidase n=1 Tax=Obba rivulosa TaxID=1052685 RepID=A0A8E2AT70_9APHY|nr:proline-specific peptidase [Obba rivulosa]